MKKKTKKKTGNDYPLFGFRLDPDQKEDLSNDLIDILDIYNGDLDKYEKKYSKKDIFLKALVIGFKELKRRKN